MAKKIAGTPDDYQKFAKELGSTLKCAPAIEAYAVQVQSHLNELMLITVPNEEQKAFISFSKMLL